MEHSAILLIKNRKLSIGEISKHVGFSSNSSFTKSFKKNYNQSPTEFRKHYKYEISKIRQINSNIGQDLQSFENYICEMKENKNWLLTKGNISIIEAKAKHCATIFHIGDYGFAEKFEQLLSWVNNNDIVDKSNIKMGTVYYDSYKTTEASKVRKSAFVLLDNPIEADELVMPKSISAGKYITIHCELSVFEFSKAWSGLFVWMSDNGYNKSDKEPFEVYHNNFNDHPEKKCLVDLFIPIK